MSGNKIRCRNERNKMRAIIQRVSEASVTIAGKEKARIGQGYLILLGVGQGDSRSEAEKLWRKISALRIFEDENGKTNLSLSQVGGNVLIVSQFTLWANCKKGNRPSFIEAADPKLGNELYEYFLELASIEYPEYGCGQFGADMQVSLINDGPFTLVLDTDNL